MHRHIILKPASHGDRQGYSPLPNERMYATRRYAYNLVSIPKQEQYSSPTIIDFKYLQKLCPSLMLSI